jgi:hypothetical protein
LALELRVETMDREGATVPVKSRRACVVYDAASGRIHHYHKVVTLVGGREPDESEVAADALRALRSRREPPKGKLGVLHVAHDIMDAHKNYRVDLKKKSLVISE